ncbi:MAG TPA: carboxypeptidase-like regulatory domain-containing protein [Abditibacteriaceae bacterium]
MRNFVRLLFIFQFSFFVLYGGEAQPLPERAPLLGKVATTAGSPIGGATVALRRQDNESVVTAAFWGGKQLTGADGVFSFPEAEEGIYYLTVDAEGYENFNWTLEWKPQSPTFWAKMLKLTPQPLRVLKTDGQPAAGAKVFLHFRALPPGHISFYSYEAGADGRINVPSLTPANYWVHAVAPGLGYAIMPNLIVKENEPQLIDLKFQPGGRARAVAKTADGRPLGGAALALSELLPDTANELGGATAQGNDGAIYLQTQHRSTLVTQDGSGQMELQDVAPGRYQARLYIPGEANPPMQTIEVKNDGTTEVSGVYNLQNQKASIEVTVQTPDDKPAANREFVASLQPLRNGQPVPAGQVGPPVPPDVAPTTSNLFQGVLSRRFKTDANGKATLFPLSAGDWQITIFPVEQLSERKPKAPTTTAKATEAGGTITIKLLQ